MYTIAQIAIIVFALDTGTTAAICDVSDYWLTNNPSLPNANQQSSLATFDAWVKCKGKLVEMVFDKACLDPVQHGEDESFFISILDAMLA
jgi:hypothetical protein